MVTQIRFPWELRRINQQKWKPKKLFQKVCLRRKNDVEKLQKMVWLQKWEDFLSWNVRRGDIWISGRVTGWPALRWNDYHFIDMFEGVYMSVYNNITNRIKLCFATLCLAITLHFQIFYYRTDQDIIFVL